MGIEPTSQAWEALEPLVGQGCFRLDIKMPGLNEFLGNTCRRGQNLLLCNMLFPIGTLYIGLHVLSINFYNRRVIKFQIFLSVHGAGRGTDFISNKVIYDLLTEEGISFEPLVSGAALKCDFLAFGAFMEKIRAKLEAMSETVITDVEVRFLIRGISPN